VPRARPARPHTTTVVAIRERAHERVERRTTAHVNVSLARAVHRARAPTNARRRTSIARRWKPSRSEDDERDRRRARDGRRDADGGLVERLF
jgi:beta-phosphoglucomutase-like phosphatase (HAD superfamily)